MPIVGFDQILDCQCLKIFDCNFAVAIEIEHVGIYAKILAGGAVVFVLFYGTLTRIL